ncbi:MAG: MiaB/RimO family radical SAM methylthiotransferase [Desulfarculus sp.]|nr:MAG: MiaB/RimO family radical SAM methylthiotransferase [Desulfarculus sp.]
MKRFVVTSLGCKVNQAEAASLAADLAARGWQPAAAGQAADLAVLLTCAVTGPAARQSRQMARRLAREHPGAQVVVTGCDLQAEPRAYVGQGQAVLGRALLPRLAELLEAGALPVEPAPPAPDAGALLPGQWQAGGRRSRALLKVQDGCNASCAYCIVPLARGRSRSLPLDQAVAAWQELGQTGAPEVVLTGIHLGRWGQDLDPPAYLTHLLRALLAAHPDPRLRLSSLECQELTDQIIALAAIEPRLCRHFHLPLQSGSERVLKAMGRPYGPADYAARVRAAHQALPGLCLGADVLAGLPGEDAAAFADTYELIQSLPLSYLHVFPYSPRPGTRAAAMPNRPPARVAKQRAARLRELGQAKRRAFLQEQLGRVLEVVVERSGLGRSGNYCLVALDGPLPPGERALVEIEGLQDIGKGPVLRGRVLA